MLARNVRHSGASVTFKWLLQIHVLRMYLEMKLQVLQTLKHLIALLGTAVAGLLLTLASVF